MQAPLALIAGLLGLWSSSVSRDVTWLVGAILILVVVPFTLVAIFPINKQLTNENLDVSSPEAEQLLRRWGRLHAIRTAVSLIAFVIFLIGWSAVR